MMPRPKYCESCHKLQFHEGLCEDCGEAIRRELRALKAILEQRGERPKLDLAMTTVDGDLLDSLQEAIDFVAERGGGVVYTELAGTQYAKSLKLPEGVQIQARRPVEQQQDAPA